MSDSSDSKRRRVEGPGAATNSQPHSSHYLGAAKMGRVNILQWAGSKGFDFENSAVANEAAH
jgi:hypothetical protein